MPIKATVKLTNLAPQMALAFVIVQDVYRRIMEVRYECTVTSGNDSKHSEKSLHHCVVGKYTDGVCRALDLRTKNYVGDKKVLRDDVADALGAEFDVVLEDLDGDNEHLHVEYDP